MVECTVGELLKRRAKKTPGKTALEFKGKTVSWGEIDEYSDILAEDFRRMGIHKGTMAGLWCENQTGWILVYFALQKCGAAAVLMNPDCPSEELQRMLDYADIEYLFSGDQSKGRPLGPVLAGIQTEKLPKLKKIISVSKTIMPIQQKRIQRGDAPAEDCSVQPDIGGISADTSASAAPADCSLSPQELSSILFTSGTSSEPKGVMLSHFNLINDAAATARAMRWTARDKVCVIVPLFHCFGLVSCLLASLIAGSTLHLLPRYRTKEALEAVSRAHCTAVNGVPTMFLAMSHSRELQDYDTSSLRSGIIAGSMVSPEEYRFICQRLGIKKLQMSYGQTETCAGVTFSAFQDSIEEKCDNTGFPVPGTQICIWDRDGEQFIWDPDANENVRNAENRKNTEKSIYGEIGVKGFGVMMGYYKRPKETAAVLGEDGWLLTGDMGFIDEKGRLHIEGRKNERIVRGGENISPAGIEECLKKMGQIRQVKVIGVPHRILQEEIAACIVMEEGYALDPDEIRKYAARHLAAYKVPEYILEFARFPMNASGKIETGRLKEQAAQKIRIQQEHGQK